MAPIPLVAHAESSDPIGDLIGQVAAKVEPLLATFGLKATLYHGGIRGYHEPSVTSLGCKVVPMRTAAVDGVKVPPATASLFIKETVGLAVAGWQPSHDGYWYASDTGGAIHAGRIDLFTGQSARSMTPLMPLNLATLTVATVGVFEAAASKG